MNFVQLFLKLSLATVLFRVIPAQSVASVGPSSASSVGFSFSSAAKSSVAAQPATTEPSFITSTVNVFATTDTIMSTPVTTVQTPPATLSSGVSTTNIPSTASPDTSTSALSLTVTTDPPPGFPTISEGVTSLSMTSSLRSISTSLRSNQTVTPGVGSGLSSGAIGGIIGGVLGTAFLLSLAVIVFLLKRKKSNVGDIASDSANIAEPKVHDGTGEEKDISGRLQEIGEPVDGTEVGGRLRYPDDSIVTGGRLNASGGYQ